jgi:hypothetical protein
MKTYKSFKFGDDGDKSMYCEYCKAMTWHRYRPSPEAGPYWRCSVCNTAKEESE